MEKKQKFFVANNAGKCPFDPFHQGAEGAISPIANLLAVLTFVSFATSLSLQSGISPLHRARRVSYNDPNSFLNPKS